MKPNIQQLLNDVLNSPVNPALFAAKSMATNFQVMASDQPLVFFLVKAYGMPDYISDAVATQAATELDLTAALSAVFSHFLRKTGLYDFDEVLRGDPTKDKADKTITTLLALFEQHGPLFLANGLVLHFAKLRIGS